MIRGLHQPHACGDDCLVCLEQATLIELDWLAEQAKVGPIMVAAGAKVTDNNGTRVSVSSTDFAPLTPFTEKE